MQFSLKTKITTPAFQETLDYYQEVFNMKVVEEWDKPDDRGAIMVFADGQEEALIEIYFDKAPHDFSGLSLQFRVDSLDRFVGELPASIEREGPKPRPWGATYLYLRDPNGITIIVYEGCL